MPHLIPEAQYDAILQAVEKFPLGASVITFLSLPEIHLPKRTLQRRLDQLVGEDRLSAIGRARSRRYTVLSSMAESPLMLREEPAHYATRLAWLSPAGREVRALVSRSLAERKPVGYRRKLLDDYAPNVTFYLPKELRRNLAEIGHVGLANLPAGT
jgi:hypothetical protein